MWRARGDGMSEARPGSALIGRKGELAALRASVDRLGDGVGGCLVLSGPPGIGKSKLLAAAATEARASGVATAVGRATERDRAYPLRILRRLLSGARPHAVRVPDAGPDLAGLGQVEQIGAALDEYRRPLVIIL